MPVARVLSCHHCSCDLQRLDAADLRDRDPGQHDDHRHLQGKLEQVRDQHAPQSADKCVESGEGNQHEHADDQRGLPRIAQRVVQTWNRPG